MAYKMEMSISRTLHKKYDIKVMFSSLFVCLSVCLLAALRKKTSARICMKFSGKVGNGPMNKRLNFGGDPDHSLDTGIVAGFVTIERYGKLYQPTAMDSLGDN